MTDSFEIRAMARADLPAVETLYSLAFPGEDLYPLVRDLSRDETNVRSFVADMDSDVVGHAVFTMCGVEDSDAKGVLLGPLAVEPGRQRRGIGSAIVQAGLARMAEEGVDLVCVLGDPAYYGRLGFATESLIEAPYPLPNEWRDAWQSQYLGEAVAAYAGKLIVPAPWREPALWAP